MGGNTYLAQDDGDVIASAACGDLHSALLAASGAVYTAGCNRQGQCGQDPQLLLVSVLLLDWLSTESSHSLTRLCLAQELQQEHAQCQVAMNDAIG
jgi:alpha-tubulin suppressor-like RCC1 family protein